MSVGTGPVVSPGDPLTWGWINRTVVVVVVVVVVVEGCPLAGESQLEVAPTTRPLLCRCGKPTAILTLHLKPP